MHEDEHNERRRERLTSATLDLFLDTARQLDAKNIEASGNDVIAVLMLAAPHPNGRGGHITIAMSDASLTTLDMLAGATQTLARDLGVIRDDEGDGGETAH